MWLGYNLRSSCLSLPDVCILIRVFLYDFFIVFNSLIPTEARERILFRCMLFETLTVKEKAGKQLQIGSRDLFQGITIL